MAAEDIYGVLAARHGKAESQRYRRILEHLLTPQQARIAAELPMHGPSPTPQELAERTGLDTATIARELDILFRKGVVFPRNFRTQEHPRFARSLTQIHDASQSLEGISVYDEAGKRRLWELWEEFMESEWNGEIAQRIMALERPPSRILPAYRAIADLPDVLMEENIAEILKAQSAIAIVSCSCRKRKGATGNPCSKSHDFNCFQFNRSAEYVAGRGHGRLISYDEAMELIQEVEEDGLLHIWPNSPTMTTNTMCNCCRDCCMNLHPMDQYGVPWDKYYERSRYQAVVDSELCNGCDECIDRCHFDAISLEEDPESGERKAVIDAEKCFGCGVCVVKCGLGALQLQAVRPPEHVLQAGIGAAQA